MLDLIFFGILAIVLVFKLYSIIGKEDADQVAVGKESGNRGPIDITSEVLRNKSAKEAENAKDAPLIEVVRQRNHSYNPTGHQVLDLINPAAAEGFEKIKGIFPEVTELGFVQDFGEVFVHILEAYNTGETSRIADLVSHDILQNINSAIKQRKQLNLDERIILVKINSIRIEDAKVQNGSAQLEVSVSSEQIHYVLNDGGQLIQGSDKTPQHSKESFIVSRHTEGLSSWVVSGVKGSL